ncbi:MAG: sugar ABC transporter ATP-binding protein [Lachnospiraceae bacterium]|nr:sugar ABC transporter ATP-binding protein [Lachnospiraceae bacterium]
MRENVLEMKNIQKSYFGTKVLHDINLSLKEGEIVGLVGENGAGKSTLMNILFGDEVIASTGGYDGEIKMFGKTVHIGSSRDALKLGIGMVHQEFSLIPGFTATENILFNREPIKKNVVANVFGERLDTLDRKKMREMAKSAIDKVGIKIDDDMLVSVMPVGHKQFTEIAREISKDNLKVLILDEPTAVLTEKEASTMLESIKSLASKGIAIVFISHRLNEILDVCNKVVIIRDGYVVKDSEISKITVNEITKHMIGREVDTKKRVSRNLGDREIIMSIKNLYVDMPGENVKNLSLDVRDGEILGIGGLAGQGKLGIPNGIMGLYDAEGEVLYKNEKINISDPMSALNKDIAFVSEDRRGVGLLLDETLEWNISFLTMQVKNKFLKRFLSKLISFRDNKAIKDVTDHYIEALNIKCTSSKQKAKELSGGNQQKVCLAKAFAMQPKFLFVSEPTRGIDVGAKALVLDALKGYNEKYGTTVVMISSEIEELRQICDRIAIVSDGKVAGIYDASESAEKFGALMIGASAGGM